MANEKPNPHGKANFALGPEYLDLLESMAEQTMLKKSAIIRVLLDVGAERLGLEPVNPVPKSLVPAG